MARGDPVARQQNGKRKAGGAVDKNAKRAHVEGEPDTQHTKQALPINPLSSLAGYGSDSDNQNSDNDIMDPEKDAISSKDPNSVGVIALPSSDERPKKEKTKRLCRNFQRGKCSRGDSCLFLHEKRPKTPRNTVPEQPVEIFRTRSGLLEKVSLWIQSMY
jgi:Zinc finger C-x8-C-x5-C-x3-H type (and similar)